MPIRFTLGTLFLATAVIAVLGALARMGGFTLAFFALMAYTGIGLLICSALGTTVQARRLMIVAGVGLMAAAVILFVVPAIQ